jgi:hypothetical protein
MTDRKNGALRLCLTGSALGGLIAFAFVPAAKAQWLTPWRAASPGEIERSLEAQGYGLIAPLVRRPEVYLADVSAGPAGYQRLVIDARSGQILERFIAPGRMWGPRFAARDEEFGEPPRPGGIGPPLSPSVSGRPAATPPAKSAYGGPADAHIPAAISPYGAEAPAGTKPRPKSMIVNPPLPPPAPREAAKPDGSGSPASKPAEKHDSDQPKIDFRPTEVDNVPPAAAPAAPGLSGEPSDKSKVSIVPAALFE